MPLVCLGLSGAIRTYSQPRRSRGSGRSNFTIRASLSFFTTGTRRTLGSSRALCHKKNKRGKGKNDVISYLAPETGLRIQTPRNCDYRTTYRLTLVSTFSFGTSWARITLRSQIKLWSNDKCLAEFSSGQTSWNFYGLW